jgi:hypothetical protein
MILNLLMLKKDAQEHIWNNRVQWVIFGDNQIRKENAKVRPYNTYVDFKKHQKIERPNATEYGLYCRKVMQTVELYYLAMM